MSRAFHRAARPIVSRTLCRKTSNSSSVIGGFLKTSGSFRRARHRLADRSRPGGGGKLRGCGAEDAADCLLVEDAAPQPPRAGFFGIPAAFQRFPLPDFHRVGAASLGQSAARDGLEYPTCSPPSMQDASRSTPQRGGMREV
jgi:hypothetical protein